jgi:hypothetical protein
VKGSKALGSLFLAGKTDPREVAWPRHKIVAGTFDAERRMRQAFIRPAAPLMDDFRAERDWQASLPIALQLMCGCPEPFQAIWN